MSMRGSLLDEYAEPPWMANTHVSANANVFFVDLCVSPEGQCRQQFCHAATWVSMFDPEA